MAVKTAKGEVSTDVRRQHIENWRSSGLPKETYCTKNGVSLNQLTYWQRKLGGSRRKQPTKPQAFARVVAASPAGTEIAAKPGGLRLVIGDAFVEIRESADPVWAARVIAAVGGRA